MSKAIKNKKIIATGTSPTNRLGGKKKRPGNPMFKGKDTPGAVAPFSSTNQPSIESKRKGWEEYRARRMLTQAIVRKMARDNNLSLYVDSLMVNAVIGNSKAMETINRCLEDDVQKIEVTTTGTTVIDWNGKTTTPGDHSVSKTEGSG